MNNQSWSIDDLTAALKEYVQLNVSLAKIELTERVSQVIAVLLIVIIGATIGLGALLFALAALAFYLAPLVGGLALSTLLIAGIALLLLAVVLLLRRTLIVDPIMRTLARILLK